MTSPTFISSPPTRLSAPATPHAHPGKVRRIKCPVHGGTDRNVSLGNGWAKCHSRGCSSKDILAALNLAPALRYSPPPMPPRLTISTPPLPPISHTAALAYLAGIHTPEGAEVRYQRYDGQSGKHWRNLDKRRNPGVTGDGWQVRRFDPADAAAAPAIALTEGEKDSAVLALSGLIAFCAPRGAGSLPAADLSELVALAKETGLPVILAGDNDNAGHDAMLRIRESLRKAGLKAIDTASHAPLKGSIADLPHRDLLALVDAKCNPPKAKSQKPVRSMAKYKDMMCQRPMKLQCLGSDSQGVKNYHPCGNAGVCHECAKWEIELHIQRVLLGEPGQWFIISGFGDGAAEIDETTWEAKQYREKLTRRIRPSSQKYYYGETDVFGYMTALKVDPKTKRGQLTVFLRTGLRVGGLAREDEIAKQAGLTFDLQFHKPSHDSIEAKAAHLRGLTIAVKSPDGATSKINSWTSGNWPEWEEPKKTYALNDGRELAEGEEFEPDSVSVHVWRKENRQAWNKGQTVAWNYEQREEYALRNSQLWMSAVTGLNLEILTAIGDATTAGEVAALVAEIGDCQGPTALLRDAAAYLRTGKKWRKAYGPVLNAAGWAG